jgi:hypothetical protein
MGSIRRRINTEWSSKSSTRTSTVKKEERLEETMVVACNEEAPANYLRRRVTRPGFDRDFDGLNEQFYFVVKLRN